jgi:hypothetical protein
MMKKWMLFIALLLVLPTLACSFSVDMDGETPEATSSPATEEVVQPLPTAVPPTPEPPPVTGPNLYDVFFASGVTDDGDPIDVADVFPEGTTIVYAFVSYEGMGDVESYESVWYQDGEEDLRNTFNWNQGEAGGPVWIVNLENENGLLPARYDWELYIDGDLIVADSFVVEEAPSVVLLEDDFSDPTSGWAEAETESRRAGYKDGYYFITALEGSAWSWPGLTETDVVIEVEATQADAGPENDNSYGVICRLQSDSDGYFLRISGDGYYSIAKRVDSEYEYLVNWATSDVIRQGNSTNLIRAVCDGSTLTLEVNGQVLGETTDSTFTEGDVGLVVGTYEDEATEVHFDNLLVTAAPSR